jgi:GLPGLI family protein
MKSMLKLFWFFISFVISASLAAQKRITEGIITYDITVITGDAKPSIPALFDGATSVVYLKGYQCRFERISSLGVESTLIDNKAGKINVLKEYGDQKYWITMTPENWQEANAKYAGIRFDYKEEYKEIAGYSCQKAIGKTPDGSDIIVFFTKDLLADNREFEYACKSLPGLAMEYETTVGHLKVKYTVSKVSFSFVPLSKFELPKSGFRMMSFEESKNLNRSKN